MEKGISKKDWVRRENLGSRRERVEFRGWRLRVQGGKKTAQSRRSVLFYFAA